MQKPEAYPPGHPRRDGLCAALRGRGASSILVNFRREAGGYRLQSYRVAPENVPLPAELASQLRRLAQTAIDASLPGNCRV